MNRLTKIALAAVLFLQVLLLTACGGSGLSEEEIREIYRDLVEESYVLNDVYYGDGLPFVEDEKAVATLLGLAAGTELSVNYMPVSKEAPFQTEDEIRAKTAEVFSPDMCALLYEIGFTGVSTEDESRVAFARYVQQDGFLTVRIDLAEDAINVARTYDFDAMTVISDKGGRIRAEFPSFLDGEKSVNVKITVVKTEDGWRLDSPTY